MVNGKGQFWGRMQSGPLQPMVTLWHTCAKVHEPSELRFGVVCGVDRGIAILDGGPRHARAGLGVPFPNFYWGFPTAYSNVAAWSICRCIGQACQPVGLQRHITGSCCIVIYSPSCGGHFCHHYQANPCGGRLSQRRSPVPTSLWADLFLYVFMLPAVFGLCILIQSRLLG